MTKNNLQEMDCVGLIKSSSNLDVVILEGLNQFYGLELLFQKNVVEMFAFLSNKGMRVIVFVSISKMEDNKQLVMRNGNNTIIDWGNKTWQIKIY